MEHPNSKIMERAIKIAKERCEFPSHAVAAIIIKDDEIIAEGVTTIVPDTDPTGHAEINAIRQAAQKLGSVKLKGCHLYSTYEPCPMCSTAIIWAGIESITFGAAMEDETEKYPQDIKISCAEVIERSRNNKPKLYSNFMREQCKELLDI